MNTDLYRQKFEQTVLAVSADGLIGGSVCLHADIMAAATGSRVVRWTAKVG